MSRFLRVEAVNLSNFIYETQDLSTIRGGGLLLLDVSEKVSKYLQEEGCNVQPAVHGASTGRFEIEAGTAECGGAWSRGWRWIFPMRSSWWTRAYRSLGRAIGLSAG